MTRGICPCTVLTLTRNSGKTLASCLKSGLFAKEHLLIDGRSSDDTLVIARSHGCRIVLQDDIFLDPDGRIIDYSGVRFQGVCEATNHWIFMLDCDEYIDEEMKKSIEKIVSNGDPGVYQVTRLYVNDGHVIRYASTYPNRQIRFFHKDAIKGFEKPVHERPVIKDGFCVEILSGFQYVPLVSVSMLKQKFARYILLEVGQSGQSGWFLWFAMVVDKYLRLSMRAFRILRGRLLHRVRDCLPLKYERLYFWYAWTIIWRSCPLFRVAGATSRLSHRDVKTTNPNG